MSGVERLERGEPMFAWVAAGMALTFEDASKNRISHKLAVDGSRLCFDVCAIAHTATVVAAVGATIVQREHLGHPLTPGCVVLVT